MNKRLLLVMLSILAVLSLVAACGGSTTPTTAPTQTITSPTATQTTIPTTTPTGAPTPTSAAQPIKLRFSTSFTPPPTWYGVRPQMWMDEMTKRSNGQVTFETFWGGTLGTGTEQLNLLRKGTTDVGFIYFWYQPEQFPLAYFEYATPFGPSDPVMNVKAYNQMISEFPQMVQEMNNNHMKLLMSTLAGFYSMSSKKELKTTADVKGMKISLVGQWLGEAAKAAGAVPITAAVTERYEMLQRGTVHGDILPLTNINDYKLYEVAKYWYDIGLNCPVGTSLAMNLETYQKLPPNIQKIVDEVSKDIETAIADKETQMNKDSLDNLKAKGMTVGTLSADELTKWMQAAPDIGGMWATQIEGQYRQPGYAMIQRYQQITTQMGYKWLRNWAVK